MKNSIISLFVISLLLYSSISLVVMNHMDSQGHGDCPLQAAGMVACVRVQNPIAFILSHISTVSQFFLAIPADSFAVSLTILLALVFAALFGLAKQLRPLLPIPSFVASRPSESFVSLNRILLNRWFALHENSPSFS